MTVLLLLCLWLINRLPFRVKIRLGLAFGRLLYHFLRSRASIARTNIALCFSELSEEERERMVIDTFRNAGAGLVETAIAWWDKPERIYQMTEIRGGEYLEKARSQGRGVILLGAHFSTLDISGMLISKHMPVYAIFREQNNRLLNYFMIRGRNKNLLEGISYKSFLSAVKRIKEGHVVWCAADQDMGEKHSVYAPFFGHPAATINTISRLAKMTGAPLVMMITRRKEGDPGYILEYSPSPKGFPFQDDVENAKVVNQLIEEGIRRAPSQYYWFHRRFKTQPGMKRGGLYR